MRDIGGQAKPQQKEVSINNRLMQILGDILNE